MMKSRKNRLFVLVIAVLMFTSTWAGVFAADSSQAKSEKATENDQITATEEQAAEDVQPAAEEGLETSDVTIAAPVAVQNGSEIVVTWTAPTPAQAGTITYEVYYQQKNEGLSAFGAEQLLGQTGELTTKKIECTEGATYKFKVKAKIESTTIATSAPSEEITFKTKVVPSPASNIEALSGCDMVRVRWTESPDAEGYVIKRYDSVEAFNADQPSIVRKFSKNDAIFTRTGTENKLTWDNTVNVKVGQDYWYRVYAANCIDAANASAVTTEMLSAPLEISKGPVRPMRITFKLKKTRTLTPRKGGKKVTIPANTSLVGTGYGGGCYYFYYKSKLFRVSRTSAKSQKALYNGKKGWNYTREEAELFVNGCGVGSKTNNFIWVSFYTQRLYVLTRTASGWKCTHDWNCATGKASTPSPTGVKAINSFRKTSHHGIKWWSGFSGGNSIHGKKSGWILGLPQSHGCIRNDVDNAKYVFYNCKKNTRVYNY